MFSPDEIGKCCSATLSKRTPRSVTHWKTLKANNKKRIRKSKLPGGLPKWSELKREKTALNRIRDSWSYQKVDHEMKVMEAEKQKIRDTCWKRTKAEKQASKEDEKHFQELLRRNSGEIDDINEPSFGPDDRDLGLNGYPIAVDSDLEN